ncbi:MAG: serine hydrolase [Flavobacteriales bacterium]|nr:serine hydrolase [Flavobacteriales bacterium]
MRPIVTLLAATALSSTCAQSTYFPPLTGNAWTTVDPASLGWCTDEIPPLLTYLGDNNSKAFIVLKDGKIAIEQYYGTFTQDSLWYWASAGKSLTAFLVGKAQEEGFLDIDDPSSDYLGTGWTSCTPEQEAAITVRHQLTMTTGLDDGTGDVDCTDPACLHYLADPGTRWAYHNAAYTKLDGVISAATGQTINTYLFNKLTLTTGLQGAYVPVGYNNVFFSKARHFARFGLLAMEQGNWNGTAVMSDASYFAGMTTPSQALNEAYGYLWWLNGQSSYMVPGLQLVLPGMLIPNEPPEAYNALGKNGQILCVVPSQGLVVVRMGDPPGSSVPVPYLLADEIWQRLNLVLCASTSTADAKATATGLFPVPASDQLMIHSSIGVRSTAQVITLDGRTTDVTIGNGMLDLSELSNGLYWLRYSDMGGNSFTQRFEVAR